MTLCWYICTWRNSWVPGKSTSTVLCIVYDTWYLSYPRIEIRPGTIYLLLFVNVCHLHNSHCKLVRKITRKPKLAVWLMLCVGVVRKHDRTFKESLYSTHRFLYTTKSTKTTTCDEKLKFAWIIARWTTGLYVTVQPLWRRAALKSFFFWCPGKHFEQAPDRKSVV